MARFIHLSSITGIISLTLSLCMGSLAQPVDKVSLTLKNNGLRPREFKFLERHPTSKYPNVFTAFLLPGQTYKVTLKVGTSLAQVTQPEINATMRGQEVAGKSLLVVAPGDNGREVKLVQR